MLRKLVFPALLVFVLTALPVKAVTITLNGNTYDVIAYTPNASAQSILDTLDDQPWWGNSTLAQSAAAQVNSQLGAFYQPQLGWGPFFIHTANSSSGFGSFWYGQYNTVSAVSFGLANTTLTYAIVNTGNTASSVPDSGATAFLLGAAVLGLMAIRRSLASTHSLARF